MSIKSSKVLQAAIASIEEPLKAFFETGLYFNERDYGGSDDPHAKYVVPGQVTDRIARQYAKEARRPFIVCGKIMARGRWINGRNSDYLWEAYDKPAFISGTITLPRRKYLAAHITPFQLIATPAVSRYMAAKTGVEDAKILDHCSHTLWCFTVHDEPLWNEMYTHILNDPELRKARKVPGA